MLNFLYIVNVHASNISLVCPTHIRANEYEYKYLSILLVLIFYVSGFCVCVLLLFTSINKVLWCYFLYFVKITQNNDIVIDIFQIH